MATEHSPAWVRRIFLSHNVTNDGASAALVAETLAEQRPNDQISLSSSFDSGPEPGAEWFSWIRRSIVSCDLVVFLASEHAKTPWCMAELGLARFLDKPVLQLWVDDESSLVALVDSRQAAPLQSALPVIGTLIDNRIGPSGDVALPENFEPYPGLRPLNETERVLLSGRHRDTNRMVSMLTTSLDTENRPVVVSGPSGSGKSSVVRAGVIPTLLKQGWSVDGPMQPAELRDSGLPDAQRVPDRRRVAVVDQFEEIALMPDEWVDSFVKWIGLQRQHGVRPLFIVRSEFRDHVAARFPNAQDVYIGYLGYEDLEDVIRGPARLANLAVADDLVAELVRQTKSGSALPLLSFTLRKLWELRDRDKQELRRSDLDALGGVEGVIAGQAEEALFTVTGGNQSTRRDVLATLTRLAEVSHEVAITRSPVRVNTLADRQRFWLDEFAERGLISYRTSYALDDSLVDGLPPSGKDLADVTHEAFFDWPELAQAITDEADRNAERRLIEQQARQWASNRHDHTLLLEGDRLTRALETDLGHNDPELGRYLDASRRHDRTRRTRRRLTVAVGVLAVLAVAGAGLAWFLRGQAVEAATYADSVGLAARATERIDDQRDLAMLTAVAAYRVDANPFTEAALFDVLTTPYGPHRFVPADIDWQSFGVGPSSTSVAVTESAIEVIDTNSGQLQSVDTGGLDVTLAEVQVLDRPDLVLYRGLLTSGRWELGVADLATGQRSWIDHEATIGAMAALDDLIVFGDSDGSVFALDRNELMASSQDPLLTVLSRGLGNVTDVAVAPDGRFVAFASSAQIGVVERVGSGWASPVDLHTNQGGLVTDRLIFRQDGPSELFAAGGDPVIHRWTEVENGSFIHSVLGDHRDPVFRLASAPNRPVLATAGRGGVIRLWDLDSGVEYPRPLVAHSAVANVFGLGFIDDGFLVSADADGAVVWNIDTGRTLDRPDLLPAEWQTEFVKTIVLGEGSPAIITFDDRLLVADGFGGEVPDGTRRAWRAGPGVLVEIGNLIHLHRAPMDLAYVDSTGTTLLGTNLQAVDVGDCVAAVAEVDAIRFVTPPGCTGPDLPSLAITDLPEGGVTPTSMIEDIALSPDQSKIAVAFSIGLVRIHDTAVGRILQEIGGSSDDTVTLGGAAVKQVAWLDDHRLVLGVDRPDQSFIVDLAVDGGRRVHELQSHDDVLWWFAVDRGGQRLFTAGQDGLITQVDISDNNYQQVGRPWTAVARSRENDIRSAVTGLWLNDDGTALFAVQDGKIRSWTLDIDDLIRRACDQANRPLTSGERQNMGIAEDFNVCGDR